MMSRTSLVSGMLLAACIGGGPVQAGMATRPDIRLVLQITADGLRADLLARYQASFGKAGPGIDARTIHR